MTTREVCTMSDIHGDISPDDYGDYPSDDEGAIKYLGGEYYCGDSYLRTYHLYRTVQYLF